MTDSLMEAKQLLERIPLPSTVTETASLMEWKLVRESL